MICDLIRKETSADCALINSGSIRADMNYGENRLFTYGDVHDIYPFQKELCLIGVTGINLYLALENGVSKYPAMEGRFPHVSNIYFEFDPERPPHARVNKSSILIAGFPLDKIRIYKIATTNFLADGKDDYSSFKNCIQYIDDNSRKTVRDVIIDFFCMF